MNRTYRDYSKTVISIVLLTTITMLIITLITIVKYKPTKHTLINQVDKPTVYVASSNNSNRYAPSEPIKIKAVSIKPKIETIETKKEPKVGQQVLSRGGVSVATINKLTEKEQIKQYVREISAKYNNNIKPEIIMSIIEHESNYNPKARVGVCVGLMQVSNKWHVDRAARLGVNNFYDPYSNILLGVDYLNELLTQYKDIRLVLMLYNMNHNDALSMYHQGKISAYARSVLNKANNYK